MRIIKSKTTFSGSRTPSQSPPTSSPQSPPNPSFNPWLKLNGFIGGISAFTLILWLAPDNDSLWRLSAIIALMLIWWVCEVLPIAVTSLLPIILLPLLGVMKTSAVTINYTRPIIFLMFAGFTLALAMQKAQLHRRIVIMILQKTGNHVNAMVFGFMLSSFLLSMWLSNTATTAAILPIALSFIAFLTNPSGTSSPHLMPREQMSSPQVKLTLTILLGIAYAANIGGMTSLIGTAPNAFFAGHMAEQFQITIDFFGWMVMALPFTLTLLIVSWALLTFWLFPNPMEEVKKLDVVIEKQARLLSEFSRAEKAISILFGLTIMAWIFHPLIPFVKLDNVVIGISAAVLCFAMPIQLKPLTFLLKWDDMRDLPWGVLLLLGGGLALGDAMTHTGFSQTLANMTITTFDLGDRIWIAFAALGMLLTEFASNTAILVTLLPVITDIAQMMGHSPIIYGVPLTLSVSCAFMMPMATPPNALVFASGYIRVTEMIRAGLWLNILSFLMMIAIISLTAPLWLNYIVR